MRVCAMSWQRLPGAPNPEQEWQPKRRVWPLTTRSALVVPIWFLFRFQIRETLKQLSDGDFLVDARGRRYFSNDALISALQTNNCSRVSGCAGRCAGG